MAPVEPLKSKTVYVLVRFDNLTGNLIYQINGPVNYFDTLSSAQNHQLLERIKGINWHVFELEIPV